MDISLLNTLKDLLNFVDNPFLLLIVASAVIIILVVIVWITKMVIDLAPYAYVNARVRSREGKLLDDSKISELLEAGSLEEILGLLGDTEYSKYLSDIKDEIDLEKALNQYLAETYEFLYNISPEKAKKVLKIMMIKFDIKNIKTLIRAKKLGLSPEETLKLLVPIGTLSKKLKELSEMESVEEIIRGLEGTEYFKILQNASNTKEMELLLDKYYLELLRNALMTEGKEEDIFKEFFGTLIDVELLKVLLRAKVDNISAEELSKYLTSGYELPEWKLKELAGAEGIEGVIGGLEGTSYYQILSDALDEYQRTKSIYVFEKVLDKLILEKGRALSLRKPFGVGPIIGLIVGKELEIKNLKIIIKGKLENLKAEEIRSLLVQVK
ncbi:V-type ATP synthase subunit C [Methanocaldococcus infernus]